MALSLDKLKCFYIVANNASFTKAAHDLNVCQSSLSRSVASLENQLGCELFKRTKVGLLLTQDGQHWYKKISNALEAFDETLIVNKYPQRQKILSVTVQNMIENLVNQLNEEKESDKKVFLITFQSLTGEKTMKITMLTLDIYISNILNTIIQKFTWQDRTLTFSIKDATVDQMPDDVDMALLNFNHPSENFINTKLCEDELHLYASAHYLEKFGCPNSLEDIKNHTLIRPEKGDVLKTIGKVMYKPIFYKEECIKVDNLNSLVQLGCDGVGIICSHRYALRGLEHKLEKIKDIDDPVSLPMIFSVHKKIKDLPFVEEMKKEIQNVLN